MSIETRKMDLLAVLDEAQDWLYRSSESRGDDERAQNVRDVRTAVAELIEERDRLHALVNNPLTDDFLAAVRAEVAHQVERWGTVHDRAKEPQDWFWLVGYLAGKALRAHADGDEFKALHHTISTAAALANWHAHIKVGGAGKFSPGSSDLQRFLAETFGETKLSSLEPSA